jgi:MbnP
MVASAVPRKFIALLAAAAAVASTNCGDQATAPPPVGRVTLTLDHFVGADPVVLHDIRYTNAAGNHYRIDDLRYYVSDVEFVRADASRHSTTAVHLRDEAVASTREWTIDEVPYGDYTVVRFLFGLDESHNRPDGLPVTTPNLNMQWPAQLGGGYHYMQLDGAFDTQAGVSAWQAHLGRLQRENVDPQALETHFWVEIPLALHVEGNAARVEIRMDVNGWFATPNLYDFAVFGGMVMNDSVAQQALSENGPQALSLGSVTSSAP